MSKRIPGSDAIFRVSFSLIFIGAGLRHVNHPDSLVERLSHAPLSFLATAIAPAPTLIVVTGWVLLPAGIALALGFRTRLAAVALMAVLIPITIATHVGDPAAVGPLFKNIALLGGLIHFASTGGGDFSLDNRAGRS